ncbi:MAG: hypothetical protein JNL58_31165 [Planctomyces sp.]|nr:hypothetical protein [Planctomyces sp.]
MSAGRMAELPGLSRLLARCRRQILFLTTLRGLAELATVLLVCVFVGCLIDFLIPLPSIVRLILLTGSIGLAAGVFWKRLVRPLMTPIAREEIGAAVDLAFPGLQERMATMLSLSRDDATRAELGSGVMREHLEEQVRSELSRVSVSKTVHPGTALKRCSIAVLVILIALVPLVVWNSGTNLLLKRMVMPFANLGTGGNFFFEVVDGNRTVATGSDIQFAAIPRWRSGEVGELPLSVIVELKADNGHVDTVAMSFNELDSQFVGELRNAQQSFQYRVSGGGAETEWYQLVVSDPPRVVSAILTETPPAYTARPVETHEGVIGTISVFERSDLQLDLAFSEPVSGLRMVWKDFRPISSEIAVDEFAAEEDQTPVINPGLPVPVVPVVVSEDGLTARMQLTAMGSGRFEFEFQDRDGLGNPEEPERRLAVEEDNPPELRVTGVEDELEIRTSDIAPLDVVVKDDIGLGVLELYVRRNDEAERILAAEGLTAGVREWVHQFRLPLADLGASNGDRISFRVRATDERPMPEPNEVWSGGLTVRMNDQAEAIGTVPLREEDQQLLDHLRSIEEELRLDAEKVQEVRGQLNEQWDDDRKQNVRELVEKQQTQGRELQEVAQDVGEHPLMEDQAKSLMEQAESLRVQIADKLKQAASVERDEAARELQAAAEELTRQREQLHRTIEEIEQRARLEQELTELNRLALDAEELASRSEKLEQDRVEGRPEEGQTQEDFQQELSDRASEIGADSQQLGQNLNALLQRQKELLEAARKAESDKLRALYDKASELAQQQQRIADGVGEESRDAARETQPLAEKIDPAAAEADRIRREASQLNVSLPEFEGNVLETAARSLREGNLSNAKEALEKAEEIIAQSETQLKSSASKDEDANSANLTDEQRQQLAALAERAAVLRQDLEKLDSELDVTVKERTTLNEENAVGVSAFVQRLRELSQASDEVFQQLQHDSVVPENQVSPSAVDQSRQLATRGKEAAQSAQAGQFAQSQERMRNAAEHATNAARELTQPQLVDRQQQLNSLADQYSRLSQAAAELQQDDSAQLAAQRDGQETIEARAEELPEQLKDIAERMQLPALDMPQQGRLAQESSEAADSGKKSAQRAAEELAEGELQRSSESGRETAGHLNRAAQLSQQAAGNPGQPSIIPSDVGESVTDALQSLDKAQQAARSMQQQQQADGQSDAQGEGAKGELARSDQPGTQEGQSGTGAAQPKPGQDAASSSQSANGEQSGQGQSGQSGSEGQSGENQSGQGKQGQGKKGQGKNGQGQDGQGQPGSESDGESQSAQQGQANRGSAARSLSDAAQALTQAARNALPQAFTPGQLNEGQKNSGRGTSGTGNDQAWDGRNAPRSQQGRARLRDWGKLQDQLTEEIQEGAKDVVDSEYSELIRSYRRELARSVSEGAQGTESVGSQGAGKREPNQ